MNVSTEEEDTKSSQDLYSAFQGTTLNLNIKYFYIPDRLISMNSAMLNYQRFTFSSKSPFLKSHWIKYLRDKTALLVGLHVSVNLFPTRTSIYRCTSQIQEFLLQWHKNPLRACLRLIIHHVKHWVALKHEQPFFLGIMIFLICFFCLIWKILFLCV